MKAKKLYFFERESEVVVMNDEDGKQQTPGTSTRVGSSFEFITLLDGDDPVPDPELDKFNLANQILDEEVRGAKTIGGRRPLAK